MVWSEGNWKKKKKNPWSEAGDWRISLSSFPFIGRGKSWCQSIWLSNPRSGTITTVYIISAFCCFSFVGLIFSPLLSVTVFFALPS